MAERFPRTDEILDFYLVKMRERRSSAPQSRGMVNEDGDPVLRASQLGSCMYVQHLARCGQLEEEEFSAKTLRTFHHGDVLGKQIVNMYQRLGMTRYGPTLSGGETRLEDPDYLLSGHVDLILGYEPQPIEDIPAELVAGWSDDWVDFIGDLRAEFAERFPLEPGHIIVVELKTTHSLRLRDLYAKGSPAFNNGVQAGAYRLMGMKYPEQLPEHDTVEYRVEYVGKDSFGMLTFDIGPEWAVEAERRCLALVNHYNEGTSPECSCGKADKRSGWEVEYCKTAQLDAYDDKTISFICCDGLGEYTRKRKDSDRERYFSE